MNEEWSFLVILFLEPLLQNGNSRKLFWHVSSFAPNHKLRINLIDFKEIIESSSKNLPNIYQWFTKNKAIFGILPSKIYQGFTKDLTKIYERFTKSTKRLPKAIKYFFNLQKIYQQSTKNVWTKIFWYFYVFSQKYLATVNLGKCSKKYKK